MTKMKFMNFLTVSMLPLVMTLIPSASISQELQTTDSSGIVLSQVDSNYLQRGAARFLDKYNKDYQEYYRAAAQAEWVLNTYIKEGDEKTPAAAEEANKKYAEFTGSREVIQKSRLFLTHRDSLYPIQARQLDAIMYAAAANPAWAGELVQRKIEAETKQTGDLFGFDYKIKGRSVTTNDIDKLLRESNDLEERLEAWKASKEVGKGLKKGLSDLQIFRNSTVMTLDYKDYFQYQVSDYGMTTKEMLNLCDKLVEEVWPLYRELHTWARYELASKYKQKEVPDLLPAHWLPNRWGQDWSSMVDVKGMNIDNYLEEKGAEYIMEQGEAFYVSLGFDKLPGSFYELSSLYPLADDADYKKNNHASAWHINLDNDVRSLMSVEPNTNWWSTVLHELGHIYYYMEYSNDSVPIILRGGANRGYHEAMGSLIGLASLQKPFLEGRGMVKKNAKVDEISGMLREALDYIVHIPWGAGVMTRFEHELYSKRIPVNQYNNKWWQLKYKYQGIMSPEPRGEEYCDAATKTHINNDAAQYYDYSISNVLLFMFHDHIAKKILKQDPHATNYWGSTETGDFLRGLMKDGATIDWRDHLNTHLGKGMSAKAMIEYFDPLMEWLKVQNEGRHYTLPEKFGDPMKFAVRERKDRQGDTDAEQRSGEGQTTQPRQEPGEWKEMNFSSPEEKRRWYEQQQNQPINNPDSNPDNNPDTPDPEQGGNRGD